MSKYPYLPVSETANHSLDMSQVPPKYTALKHGMKQHICLQTKVVIDDYDRKRGESLCGERAVNEVNSKRIRYPCRDCLEILDRKFKSYLYDEESEVYYDPHEQ